MAERNLILRRKRLWIIFTCLSVSLDVFLTAFLGVVSIGVNSNHNLSVKLKHAQASIEQSLYYECVAKIQFEENEFVDHGNQLDSLTKTRTVLLNAAITSQQKHDIHIMYDGPIANEQVYVDKIIQLLYTKQCGQYVQTGD
jgi:hypothetical protein